MKILGGRYLDENELRDLGLERVGSNVLVHERAILVDLDRISLGSNVRIDAFCVLSASAGSLAIGDHVHIASHADIYAGGGVEIGDFCGLSQGGKIYSTNDDYSGKSLTGPTIPKQYTNVHRAPVKLGRHVVVGSGSVVLPGVEIGEGSTVGALSLVSRNLDPWGVYGGVPARRLKDRRKDLLERERDLLKDSLDPGH